MWKLFVIFKLSLLFILLTGCSGTDKNYVPVSNTELWAGDSNRDVEITGVVMAIHHPPSIYNRKAVFTTITHDDGQAMLFCMEETYPIETVLTIRGRQTSPQEVRIPHPTGYTVENYIGICVEEVVVQ